jgi:hypothetical protein
MKSSTVLARWMLRLFNSYRYSSGNVLMMIDAHRGYIALLLECAWICLRRMATRSA